MTMKALLETEDWVYRIKSILEWLNERFQTIMTTGRNLLIDGSIVPWRGRLRMRQYIKIRGTNME